MADQDLGMSYPTRVDEGQPKKKKKDKKKGRLSRFVVEEPVVAPEHLEEVPWLPVATAEPSIEESPLLSTPPAVDGAAEELPENPAPIVNVALEAESRSAADSSRSSSISLRFTINPRQAQYQSTLFNIRVGPKREIFTAHRDVLAKSPKLERQCNGKYPEAGKRKIVLDDHDPKIFALLLEYLYHGDYFPFMGSEFEDNRSEEEDVRATQFQREGDLYCMAEYYQLDDLQQLTIKKMKMLTPITFQSFLSVTEYVYDNSGTAGPFRDYFRRQIQENLPLVSHEEWLLEVVAKGGDLAQDLFLSGRALPKAQGSDEPDAESAVMVMWPEHDASSQESKVGKTDVMFAGPIQYVPGQPLSRPKAPFSDYTADSCQ